jgi:TM2 domain-containing membrane protein YozV
MRERKRSSRLTAYLLVGALSFTAVSLPVARAEAGAGACLVSCLLGPGTGEFLVNGQGTFVSCLLEWLIGALTAPLIIGLLIWIGSLIDAYNDTQDQQVNLLFVTFKLGT